MSPKRELAANGYAIVPRFFTPSQAEELRAVVLAIYELMGRSTEFPDPETEDHFRRWMGVWALNLRSLLGAQLLRRYDDVIAALSKRTRSLFGRQNVFYPAKTFFRRHVTASTILPWHIDADAAEISEQICFNVWLPIDAVGAELPSLEVISGSHRLTKSMPRVQSSEAYRDDQFALRMGQKVTAHLNLGDALIFDQFTLHRTQPIMSSGRVRTSCEFRFAKPTLKTRLASVFFPKSRI